MYLDVTYRMTCNKADGSLQHLNTFVAGSLRGPTLSTLRNFMMSMSWPTDIHIINDLEVTIILHSQKGTAPNNTGIAAFDKSGG